MRILSQIYGQNFQLERRDRLLTFFAPFKIYLAQRDFTANFLLNLFQMKQVPQKLLIKQLLLLGCISGSADWAQAQIAQVEAEVPAKDHFIGSELLLRFHQDALIQPGLFPPVHELVHI